MTVTENKSLDLERRQIIETFSLLIEISIGDYVPYGFKAPPIRYSSTTNKILQSLSVLQ